MLMNALSSTLDEKATLILHDQGREIKTSPKNEPENQVYTILLPKYGIVVPQGSRFPRCPPRVHGLPCFSVAVRTEADTLHHTSTAG